MTGHRYGTSFFDYVDASSGRSAAAFLGRLDLGFSPGSILDVGCGRGVWLAAWKSRGAECVLGLDGAYVQPGTLRIAPEEFRATDLAFPFDLGRRFDLVQCLEVAEHLPEAAAGPLVASLTRHGDVVLFSAAPPGQGGEHHVNERPPEYWFERFAAHGYAPFDCARPAVQGIDEIEPWYRFNAFVFSNAHGEQRLSAEARATRIAPGASARAYETAGWWLRRAVLRRLPRRVVEALARVQHLRRG